jgi:hypothetical protein
MTLLRSTCVALSCAVVCTVAAAPGRIAPPQKYQPNEQVSGVLRQLQGSINDIHYTRATESSSEASFKAGSGPSVPDDEGVWQVTCEVDLIDDSRFCQVRRPWAVLIVSFGTKCQPLAIVVGNEHYPGTESLLRIDGGKPMSTRHPEGLFSKATFGPVVQQLRTGKQIVTRFVRWPHKNFEDAEAGLTGFSEAVDYACWAVNRLKK